MVTINANPAYTVGYTDRKETEKELREDGFVGIIPFLKNIGGKEEGFVYLSDVNEKDNYLFNRIVDEAFVGEENKETDTYYYTIIEGKKKDFGILFSVKDTSCLGVVRYLIIPISYLTTLPIFTENNIELAAL